MPIQPAMQRKIFFSTYVSPPVRIPYCESHIAYRISHITYRELCTAISTFAYGVCEIRNPKSEIRNPKSEIRNPKLFRSSSRWFEQKFSCGAFVARLRAKQFVKQRQRVGTHRVFGVQKHRCRPRLFWIAHRATCFAVQPLVKFPFAFVPALICLREQIEQTFRLVAPAVPH